MMKANTLIWRGCQSGHCWMYRDICMSICIYALTHTPEWTYTPWAHIDTYISVIRLAYRSVVHSCLIEVTYFDGNCCISNGCLSKTEVIDSNRSSPMRKCNPLTFFFFFLLSVRSDREQLCACVLPFLLQVLQSLHVFFEIHSFW